MTRLVDTGELCTSHQYHRSLEIYATPVSLQEWHPQDGIFCELTNNERFPDGPVTDAPSKFNDPIEGDMRPICQGAMVSFIRSQPPPNRSAESVKELTAQEVGGAARVY